MSKIVKAGILGCGGISHAHGSISKNVDEIKFIACCDLNIDNAKAWSDQYGPCNTYTNLEKMLENEDLDAVLVATWPNLHKEHIEQCINAGIKNILCEKALTITGEDALFLWDIAKNNNVFLMEAFVNRHHPSFKRLDEIAFDENEVGKIDTIKATFNHYVPEEASAQDSSRDWRLKKECAGGMPYDYACYPINACTHFAKGLPVRVFAQGDVSEKYQVINRMNGLIEYENGCVAFVESSKKACYSEQLHITGEFRRISLPISWTNHNDVTIQAERTEGWQEFKYEKYDIQKANPFELQLRNFAKSVLRLENPVVPLAESVVNTFIIDAMIQSIMNKTSIEISIPQHIVEEFRKIL